ncbi:hypothetical protein JG687_00016566 [Phytophthora cactorum]|uniref:Uncharacterized protein n=1 Tax=Phytophthora cactorum TaxID=29920 RepID=A0A8T1TU62_9STRA|nr:hypothetical protein JG687_00016566 [Phytophthora cactorum]
MAPTPSQLTRVLFTKVPSGRYKCCLCNTPRKLAASVGSTNTVEHLRRGPGGFALSFALPRTQSERCQGWSHQRLGRGLAHHLFNLMTYLILKVGSSK